MPGIVGLISKMPRERAERELRAMVDSVHHETSYAAGTHIEESLGVYVGWTALEGSFADGMPLRNESRDATLVFSGEEFPEPGTVSALQKRGHVIEGGPASYLVHCYEEDAGFPSALNGRFHGLLTDRTRGLATLFNDRYGLHRVYYHASKEAFYFASEAKAILAVRPELRSLDYRGMAELVSCGCVLENRTLFQGVHVLPPASAWVFRRGVLEERSSYFDPREWEEQPPLDFLAHYREVREIFSRNLPRYFHGGQRIGMSLTGGLDTRMILAWRKPEPGSLPCYSFGSMFRDNQDVLIARRLAETCGQTHRVIPVAEEFLSSFSKYAARTVYLTDGCVDVSHAADLYANQRVAKIAPVRMTGNYGSEVLRQVRAFKPADPAPGVFAGDFLPHVDSARATYNRLVETHPLSFAVFRQAPWHHYGLLALEQTQVTMRSPFLDNDFVRAVFRAPPGEDAGTAASVGLVRDGNPALAAIRTDRGLLGARNGWRGRAAQELAHFTFRAEYAYDYGMPQWLARIDHAFGKLHFERLFLGRHKFYHYRVWYRDALAAYVKEMLLDSRTLSRPYLQRKTVEELVLGHLSGSQNHTSTIHKLLTLELISRSFFDPQ
jgi:asparagine synthase (glutamine-hydrolysing)